MVWLQANWSTLLAALWGIDQILVSVFGASTVLDTIGNILKSLGAGPKAP